MGPREIIIGSAPPPRGSAAQAVVSLGMPLFERSDVGWDLMRETLWVPTLTHAVLDAGTSRATAAALAGVTGAAFWGQSWRQIGWTGGKPIVELTSKGFIKAKSVKRDFNHGIAGDVINGFINGTAFATVRYLSNPTPSGAATLLATPTGGTWGFPASLWGGTGDTLGWLRVRREMDELVGVAVAMVTDTYGYDTDVDIS